MQTFHGYVTVFQEDVIRHYQAHLANRRAARPAADYRPVTDQEWGEFEEHFDNRKVELGQCGRPYATPCEHEHACIRCPMLLVDPKMIPRLDEIHTDLLARRAHAETEAGSGRSKASTSPCASSPRNAQRPDDSPTSTEAAIPSPSSACPRLEYKREQRRPRPGDAAELAGQLTPVVAPSPGIVADRLAARSYTRRRGEPVALP